MTSSSFQIQIGMKYVWFDNLQSMDRKSTFENVSFEYLR